MFTKKNVSSPHLHHAKSIILSASDHTLSKLERKKLAVELAAHILLEAYNYQTPNEKKEQAKLYRMMRDPVGKPFTMALTDQCFRPKKHERIADQLLYLIELYGIPTFLTPWKRFQLYLFNQFGRKMPHVIVPLAIRALRKETEKVIIPGERDRKEKHFALRAQQNVQLNVNHIGEAILGEEEAERRFQVYYRDLCSSTVTYVSVKISTIFSQIHLLSPQETINKVAGRLRRLYQAALEHPYTNFSGETIHKFVNLDMEEYKDLNLTKNLFLQLLDEPEFQNLSAGIALQAYLPDTFLVLQEITAWAKKRVAAGGAPIKVRLVKGANLAMEQHEASLKEWEQTPYKTKHETDANYKRMLHFALQPENAACVHVGVGSHNLFDISYALLLRAENGVEPFVNFEMLEGMANHTRKVIQSLSGGMVLYCPVAAQKDFQSAIAYLIRRLDENTGAENFLRSSFGLMPGSKEWDKQVEFFEKSCDEMETTFTGPRRTQNRQKPPHKQHPLTTPFTNEPDTDFALPKNIEWAEKILTEWKHRDVKPIPNVIDGKETHSKTAIGSGYDPSHPNEANYTYSLADWKALDKSLSKKSGWAAIPPQKRADLITHVTQKIREKRGHLIGSMIRDGGKVFYEADIEVSEAIDFGEYYARSMLRIDSFPDLTHRPKGTILVTPPWNFPLAIPAGGLFAALVTGNDVYFKPAPQAVLIGWELVQLFWEAGIPKETLHFINCDEETTGTQLLQDPRINAVILTGATATARLFHKLRPGIDLSAETGGKNAIIVTAMADRDIAVKSIIDSAFGHAGQKCSAASLAILEREVYEDRDFLRQLRDAAASLHVGPAWDLQTKVPPLISAPNEDLYRGLTQLDDGETWLLQPNEISPNLWTPGIKIGVRRGSYSHRTEFFGPVLSVLCAENLNDAIQIANATPYGLTSGLQSLDKREQEWWKKNIIAGNLYINRGITGAIVRRQPFGGTKHSSFGHGSKAGGPNYLTQFLHLTQTTLPKEKDPVNDFVNRLSRHLEKLDLTAEELGLWYASIANYAFWFAQLHTSRDLSKIVGQDNHLQYVRQRKVVFRIYANDTPLDYLRVFAAALTCEYALHVSWEKTDQSFPPQENWGLLLPFFNLQIEKEKDFLQRVHCGDVTRIRILTAPSQELLAAASHSAAYIEHRPVLANGRFELLTFLREVAISFDYHRYGNLGFREGENRRPIL